ncbi:MAG: glycosyltransferase family 92 protein [Opitutales bacterium]
MLIGRKRPLTRLAIQPPAPASDRQGLALVTIVRNESRHIREWLRFHGLAGVSHVYLYDNGSKDETVERARSSLPASALTLTPWAQRVFCRDDRAEIHSQVLAYAHAIANFGAAYQWMAFIDADEFLVPTGAETLEAALEPLILHGQVSLPWHMFGPNGHRGPPPTGQLAGFTQRSRDPYAHPRALNFKVIADPCRITAIKVHGMEIDGTARSVNDRGQPARHRNRTDRAFYSQDRIQLNHYYTRSQQELEAKLNRPGMKLGPMDRRRRQVAHIARLIEQGTVEDTTALTFLERRGVAPADLVKPGGSMT